MVITCMFLFFVEKVRCNIDYGIMFLIQMNHIMRIWHASYVWHILKMPAESHLSLYKKKY